jgi:hypothetical protein
LFALSCFCQSLSRVHTRTLAGARLTAFCVPLFVSP